MEAMYLLFFSLLTLTWKPIFSLSLRTFHNHPRFGSDIAIFGDAEIVNGGSSVQLTRPIASSSGLLVYRKPFKFLESNPIKPTSFSTDFSFSISPHSGDGVALVIVPTDFPLHLHSRGFSLLLDFFYGWHNWFAVAMTHVVNDCVVPELNLRVEGGNGDYVELRESEECEAEGCGAQQRPSPTVVRRWGCFWRWAKMVVLLIFVGVVTAVFFKWVGPFLMEKEIIPMINWERSTFSTPVLAILLFASLALFPTFLLPSTPSMWVVGMTYGYGFGFLLIMGGVAIGVSLPYVIGSLFYHKIQGWLEQYPNKASVIKLAGEGNWFNQFRAVTLIRISPFPYIIYNYCAVATDVKYGPYLLGSLVGMVPDAFVSIYTGLFIRTLADASHDQHTLSAPQIIFNVLGFCATVATTVIVTIYAKSRLKELQKEEQLLQ